MVTGKIAYGAGATSAAVNEIGGLITIEAGENINAGNVVYVHLTDGKAYVSGTGTADDIRATGVALTTVSSGSDVDVLTRGVYTTTGLTDKEDYYLGTGGAYTTTISGVRIGTALSTTQLFVNIVQDDKDVIGTVKSYLKSFTGIPSNNLTAFLKDGDGCVLSDAESPLNGQTLPALNNSNYFLRGSTTSGTTTTGQTNFKIMEGSASNGSQFDFTSSGLNTTSVYDNAGNLAEVSVTGDQGLSGSIYTELKEVIPKSYSIVFIMKVK